MAKVFISPSTQIHNAYHPSVGGTECEHMRRVRGELVSILEARGHTVMSCDSDDDMYVPVRLANEWGAEWYLALHSNATGTAAQARGISAHIYVLGGESERLANAIMAQVAMRDLPGAGVRVNNFYELRATRMPAVLTENDFHDNVGGAYWIASNYRTIAEYHADALTSIIGMGPVVPTAPSEIAHPFPGYVQRGDRGDIVTAVQQRLRDRGWTIAVDGIFGAQTSRVVKQFQREKGLSVDGIVGPLTWDALWTAPIT